MNKQLFELGQCVATPGALALLAKDDVPCAALLMRHCLGHWGDIHPDDVGANEHAIKAGLRIMSVYTLRIGTVWVITEADRSATTVLLPEEY